MSLNRPDTLERFRLNEIQSYYMDALDKLKRESSFGPEGYGIDPDGNYLFEVLVTDFDTAPFRCVIALPGKTRLVHFADVRGGIFGNEAFFVIPGERGRDASFFANLDAPTLDAPMFAFSQAVTAEDRLSLFAAMLRYPRRKDAEYLKSLHPVSKVAHYLTSGAGHPEIFEFDERDPHQVSRKNGVESMLGHDWACFEGVLLSRSNEPFFTVLAPENPEDKITVTTCVEKHYAITPFATFSADRHGDAVGFARMLSELGCGQLPSEGADIIIHAPAYVTPRNHGTEIAYASWMISFEGYGEKKSRSDAAFDKAAANAGGAFPHWSNGGYWVDPYDREGDDFDDWKDRWSNRWKKVSDDIGAITVKRLNDCGSDSVRARMRFKPVLDYLTWGGEFWKATA